MFEGMRQYVDDIVSGLVDYARVISTSLASRGSVKASLRGTEDGAGSEDVTDCEVWGLAGLLVRPKDPTTAAGSSEGCEMVVIRWNDELLPIASRDLRFQPANVAEGEVVVHALGKDGATQATVRLRPDGTIVLDGTKIELGAGATEAVVLGDAFKTLFNAHVHPDPVSGNTLPPTVLMDDTHIASVVKTK